MKIPIRLFRPVIMREGECVPWGYSSCRYVPKLFSYEPGMEMYHWEQLAFPIPVSLALSIWYRIVYFIMRRWRVPPSMFTSKTFFVLTHCPHCKEPLREEPELSMFGGVLARIGEKVHSGIELDHNEPKS